MLGNNLHKELTVHSSLYAVPVYEKLGFIEIDDIQTEGGITYQPMMYVKMDDIEYMNVEEYLVNL